MRSPSGAHASLRERLLPAPVRLRPAPRRGDPRPPLQDRGAGSALQPLPVSAREPGAPRLAGLQGLDPEHPEGHRGRMVRPDYSLLRSGLSAPCSGHCRGHRRRARLPHPGPGAPAAGERIAVDGLTGGSISAGSGDRWGLPAGITERITRWKTQVRTPLVRRSASSSGHPWGGRRNRSAGKSFPGGASRRKTFPRSRFPWARR